MRRTTFITVFGFLTLTGIPGFAAIGGVSSLASLANDADLIAIASPTNVTESGSAAVITLKIRRVVKGDSALAGNTLAVNWNVPPGSFGPGLNQINTTLPAGANGLWFLRNSGSTWVVMPVWTGGLSITRIFVPQPATPLPKSYAYSPEDGVTDRVAAEVCFAIENTTGQDPPINMLEGPPLDALQSKYIPVLYQRLSASIQAQKYIAGIAGQIRAGNIAALNAAISSAASFLNYPSENALVLLSIRDSFRAVDAAAVSALGQAAISAGTNEPLREATAHALAMIHTAAAMPYLAVLLGDSEEKLRIEAVGGFSLFANGLPMQTPQNTAALSYLQFPASAPYKTADTTANFAMGELSVSHNEAKYVSFWKQWWSDNSARIGVTAQ